MTDDLHDPVGLALGSIGAGATTGAAVVTAGTVALRLISDGSGDLAFGVLTGGVLLGIAVAVACTFIVTTAIPDLWRRAVAGAIAAFLAVLLGAVSAPADLVAGRIGLAIYLLLLIGAAIALWRRTLARSR